MYVIAWLRQALTGAKIGQFAKITKYCVIYLYSGGFVKSINIAQIITFNTMASKNASLDFSFATQRKIGVIIKRPMIITDKINATDITEISIIFAPKLNVRPANIGNIANNGIDSKSWNNSIEKA